MIGNILLYMGQGMLLAVFIRTSIDSIIHLLQFRSVNIWSLLLIAGFLLTSIGLGKKKLRI